MKKTILSFLLCLIAYSSIAQDTCFTHLSLWHPVALPKSQQLTTHFSFGLPQSRVYNLYGVGINVIGGEFKHNMTGINLNGIYSYIKNDSRGITASGLVNITLGQNKGFQLSGLLNMAIGGHKGVQVSGVSNMSILDTRGIQMAGIYNVASNTFSGIQLSSIGNIAAKGSNALQLSLGFNMNLESMKGVQLAIGNFADTIKGLQLGLINVSNEVSKGLQLGIINYHNDTTGMHLALVNITRRSQIQMLTYAGNFSMVNVAVRIKNKFNYSIIGVGMPYDNDGDFSGALFYRQGYSIPFKRFSISADTGYAHTMVFNNDDYADKPFSQYSLQARLNLEYKINNRLSIFGSGGLAYTSAYGYTSFKQQTIGEAGILLF